MSRRPAAAPGRAEIAPFSLLVAVAAGTWAAHNLEYVRVNGPGQFSTVATRSAHAYLGPVGVILLVVGGVATWSSLRLIARLKASHVRLRRALTTAPTNADRPIAGQHTQRAPLTWPALVGLMWTLQLGLYLLQENLEAHAYGLPAPGLGAVTGMHAWAPLIHLGVAALLAATLWALGRRLAELRTEVRHAGSLLALLARRRSRHQPPSLISIAARPPAQRWGTELWARPPPLRMLASTVQA